MVLKSPMSPRKTPSKGSKPDKPMREAILAALEREAEDAEGRAAKKSKLIAERLVDKAADGDMAAIKEVIACIDGKSGQGAAGASPALEDLLERLDAELS
jgi:hypothetical protein